MEGAELGGARERQQRRAGARGGVAGGLGGGGASGSSSAPIEPTVKVKVAISAEFAVGASLIPWPGASSMIWQSRGARQARTCRCSSRAHLHRVREEEDRLLAALEDAEVDDLRRLGGRERREPDDVGEHVLALRVAGVERRRVGLRRLERGRAGGRRRLRRRRRARRRRGGVCVDVARLVWVCVVVVCVCGVVVCVCVGVVVVCVVDVVVVCVLRRRRRRVRRRRRRVRRVVVRSSSCASVLRVVRRVRRVVRVVVAASSCVGVVVASASSLRRRRGRAGVVVAGSTVVLDGCSTRAADGSPAAGTGRSRSRAGSTALTGGGLSTLSSVAGRRQALRGARR